MKVLERIDPDRGYVRWCRVGNVLYHAGVGYEVWDRWSSGSRKYSEAYAKERWDAFAKEPALPLTVLDELATESEPVPRLPWRRRLLSALSEEALRGVADEIRADQTLDYHDRLHLAAELRKVWRLVTGIRLPAEVSRNMLLQQRRKGAAPTTRGKALSTLKRCIGQPGVTEEVVSQWHLLRAYTKLVEREAFKFEAVKLLDYTGFKRYGSVKWDGRECQVWTLFPYETSLENDAVLADILSSYQALPKD